MAIITPFKGLRPAPHLAEKVATLPYDVVSVAEARKFAINPYNFYHVTRAEIDLPENVDVHSGAVYQRAAQNLEKMIADGVLIQDATPCYYIYCLVMNGREQTGLVCGSSIDDYFDGTIKKHEFTRPEKELDRINHIKATRAQTGVVFLAYNDEVHVEQIIATWKNTHEPTYDFTAEDGIQHTLWVVNDANTIDAITTNYDKNVPATYIADGHHRAASAAKVATELRGEDANSDIDAAYNYFITCIFPASQLHIMDYNRVVKDLDGMNIAEFLEYLDQDFTVSEIGTEPYTPQGPHDFGMYLDGTWYRLEALPDSFTDSPIDVLDVSILQENVLSKLLNIHDPRTDKRVDFVGGIRGLHELQQRVDSGEAAAAFALYPVSIQQLFTIADSGEVMPPKSTWFEPKVRDGLVVYRF
jgi:uncharacterized protein (DUF1015 family)